MAYVREIGIDMRTYMMKLKIVSKFRNHDCVKKCIVLVYMCKVEIEVLYVETLTLPAKVTSQRLFTLLRHLFFFRKSLSEYRRVQDDVIAFIYCERMYSFVSHTHSLFKYFSQRHPSTQMVTLITDEGQIVCFTSASVQR